VERTGKYILSVNWLDIGSVIAGERQAGR
jgi:hypothetical protein